ncbi:MAG TPA: hypothetical protein VFV78_06960 [Vicinamibacterales bacterium]|nr:hypothetical protein [Vicinamibacterales bacterium]
MGKYQPAILGGLFIGVLSSLPVVNICCCLWMVAGGVLVTYLLQQAKPEPVETGDAAIAGLIAGLIGAVIFCAATAIMTAMSGTVMQESIRQSLEQNSQIPPETRDKMIQWFTGKNIAIIFAVVTIPMFAVFSMLGSLLGLAFFRKKTPPAVPPMQG